MGAIELRINLRKPGNYAFFCPVTKLHLTLTNPVGFTDRVSPYILRGVKSKTIIDVNNVINLETGKTENANDIKIENKQQQVKQESVKSQTTVTPIQEQKEELPQEVEIAVEKTDEEVNKPRRGRRAQNNPIDEIAE